MVQVHRSGSSVSIPRRLSHHVPVVPIIDSQEFEQKLTIQFHDPASEDFQLYKSAEESLYQLVDRVNCDIVGKQKFSFKNRKSHQLTDVELKVMEMLRDRDVTAEDIIEVFRKILTEENIDQMERMISDSSKNSDEIVTHFFQKGQLRNMSLQEKMKQLIGRENVSDQEMLRHLRSQLGPKSKEQLERMLQKGASVSDIVKYFLENGKTADQENEELRQKMKKILSEGNLSPELVLSALEMNLTEAEKLKLNELIQRGLTTDEILKELMKGKESGKEREISETEQLALLRNQLGDKSKEELEKMLEEGHSLSEVIKYFMSPGPPGTAQSQDFETYLRNILQREDLSEQEKIDVIFSKLNTTERKQLNEMLSQGMNLEQIIDILSKNKKSNQDKTCHQNVTDILNNSNLTIEQKFELLKGNMKPEELREIQQLITRGLSVEEALRAVADIDEAGNTGEESDFAQRIRKLTKGKLLSQSELLERIK